MEMTFTPLSSDLLFSVRLEGKTMSEYNQALASWLDLNYLIDFFTENFELINTPFWINQGYPVTDPIDCASFTRKEAIVLNEYIEDLSLVSDTEAKSRLNGWFKPLDGEYVFVTELVPQKAYGLNYPSMLRLYAIKLADGTYVIVHGGLKLTKKMKDTPKLHETVTKKIDNVLEFFKSNGIIEKIDLL
ncbi:MAG: hypothetical protein LUD17_14780 [Bacteroidales bacterium]|nr:hypothetical protein [Bacteroidales bacterium]